MRMTLGVMALTFTMAGSAIAVEYRTPVTKQLFTCAAPGLSRVGLSRVGLSAPCCDGQLKCAQFLSTTGVLKTARDPRT